MHYKKLWNTSFPATMNISQDYAYYEHKTSSIFV